MAESEIKHTTEIILKLSCMEAKLLKVILQNPKEGSTEEYRNLFYALPTFEILDQFLLLENEQED